MQKLRVKNKLSNNKLIVTTSWDDGTASDIKLQKLLDKYLIKATFYVTKSYKYIERPLTIEEIKEIDKKNEIGAHTLTHPDLDKIDTKSAVVEIAESKKYLEDMLEHEIKMFCYPRGKYTEEIVEIIKNAGFIGARSCQHGDLSKSTDAYKWKITLHASNGSPYTTFKIWKSNKLSLKSLFDWEVRAKELFDLSLKNGGIYHLWGHSAEFETKKEWDKLESVLSYISKRDKVLYMTNGEAIEDFYER